MSQCLNHQDKATQAAPNWARVWVWRPAKPAPTRWPCTPGSLGSGACTGFAARGFCGFWRWWMTTALATVCLPALPPRTSNPGR